MSHGTKETKVWTCTCDLCGITSPEVSEVGGNYAKTYWMPRGWKGRQINGISKHICEHCMEGVS